MTAAYLGDLVGTYVHLRLDAGTISPKTCRVAKSILNRFVETVGDKAASRLSSKDVERWEKSRRDISAANYYNQVSHVRHWCRWLTAEGHVRRNPMEFAELPAVAGNPDRPRLTADLRSLAYRYTREGAASGRFVPSTAENIRYNLVKFCRVTRDPAPDGIGPTHVERWLTDLPMAPATARSRLSQLRNFFDWCRQHGYVQGDPMLGVKGPRLPRYLPRGLPHADIARLLEVCPDSRARLMCLLMCQEGLRACEVAGVQLGDIDESERLTLVKGKGGHERVLPISDETWAALENYLQEHPADGRGPLVRSYTGRKGQLSAHWVSCLVGRFLAEARVNGSGHALRHTAATDMLRNGAHLRDVQAALGHASLQTTQRYMPLVVNDLRSAMGGRKYQTIPPRPSPRRP